MDAAMDGGVSYALAGFFYIVKKPNPNNRHGWASWMPLFYNPAPKNLGAGVEFCHRQNSKLKNQHGC